MFSLYYLCCFFVKQLDTFPLFRGEEKKGLTGGMVLK